MAIIFFTYELKKHKCNILFVLGGVFLEKEFRLACIFQNIYHLLKMIQKDTVFF